MCIFNQVPSGKSNPVYYQEILLWPGHPGAPVSKDHTLSYIKKTGGGGSREACLCFSSGHTWTGEERVAPPMFPEVLWAFLRVGAEPKTFHFN